MVNIKLLERKIIEAQDRLGDWLKQIAEVAPTSERLCELTEEIIVSLEELGVAVEELYHQQDQLQISNLKIEAERRRYLELFEYAPDGYLVTDYWGMIQEANHTASEMLNRRQDYLVGKPLSIFMSPAERQRFFKFLQCLHQEEALREVEICLQPSYNRPAFTAAISIAPMRNSQNQVVGFRWLLRDITQLRKAQAESQRQQERARLLAEINLKIRESWQLETILQTAVTESQKLLQIESVVIFRLESDNSVIAIAEASSEEHSRLLDRTFSCDFLSTKDLAQLEGQNILGVSQVIPEYYFQSTTIPNQLSESTPQSQLANLVAPICVRQQLWGFIAFHRCQRTPNAPIPKQWEDFEIDICQQLADQIGIAVTHAQFIRNMEDLVTKRNQELIDSNLKLQQEIEERLQLEDLLRQSREKLYLIADSLPVLIAYIDNQQHYRFSNQAYESWFGKSVKEIYNSHLQEVVGESLYEQIKDKVKTVLSGLEVIFEIQISPQDADWHWVNITFIPHREKNDEVLGFFALIEDISERKAIEQLKDEFISVVSHELRTPLTSIHGSLRLLNSGKVGPLDEKSQQLIGLAEKNTDRLVRLVNDILDLERLDAGKTTINKEIFDAANLITTAVETMQELAQQEKISLEYTPKSIPIFADPDCILQTLTNLLSNAIKFSPANSRVTIQAEERSQEIAFQVSDRGRGIPANKLETIFERFQQVDVSDARNKQGTGLGLAICRQIVELHGGKIWAESILDRGSTFYFTLPKI